MVSSIRSLDRSGGLVSLLGGAYGLVDLALLFNITER